ncbi:sigma-70 family RNA polymerase sigma factor [Endozoicomonas sp.]|nr:sigma-70 family RNA polymerase sigma factor [Endozoicomonas sp.]
MNAKQIWTLTMDQSSGRRSEADYLRHTLVDLARYRDKKLFLQLYDYFAPRLKSYLMKQGANEEAAEDMLQEAMLSVWRKCDSYNPAQSAVSTWIYRIARNQWIDHLRKEKPQLLRSIELYPEVTQQTTIPECHDDQKQLVHALNALPTHQAQLVYKSYYEGQSHREIANALDMPLGSVKSGLRLAFKKLRRSMGGPS